MNSFIKTNKCKMNVKHAYVFTDPCIHLSADAVYPQQSVHSMSNEQSFTVWPSVVAVQLTAKPSYHTGHSHAEMTAKLGDLKRNVRSGG